MSKYIPEQHITGELGVNQFENYCLRHKPPIIFREESKNDFGIDGEVELAEYDSNKKLTVSGEIIKIQIKSTLKGSYIHKETDKSFEFHATKEDVEYWNRHNLGVVLIVFDARTESIYARKIDQVDGATLKTKIPLLFDKESNRLIIGENDFRERFSVKFKSRVDYSNSEKIALNIFRFSKLPKYLFEYKSHYTDPKDIFKIVSGQDVPNFKILGDRIFTLYDINLFTEFKSEIIDYNSKKMLSFKQSLLDEDYYNICAELVNKQFSEIVRRKKIAYNKKYKRYFFMPLFDDFDDKVGRYRTRIATYKPKKRNTATRTVVSYHTYGKSSFYRHFAFETKPVIIQDEFYLVVNPQYFFTTDGKNPLPDPDEITKLTNYLTAREFNQQNLNHIHFIHSFLCDRQGKITLCEIEKSELELSKYVSINSEFSIPLDFTPTKTALKTNQQNLFGND